MKLVPFFSRPEFLENFNYYTHFFEKLLTDECLMSGMNREKNQNFTDEFHVIDNQKEAFDLYMEQEVDEDVYTSYPQLMVDNCAYTMMHQQETELYLLDTFISDKLHNYFDNKLLPLVKEVVRIKNLNSDFIDFFVNDFSAFISYKICSLNDNNIFIQRQIKAYQSGCFPCGWLGKYPNGKLVIYSP